ncbi:hypothetical protein ACELLULO517_07810 [Acidisoma cellulosilytica]|uniref:Uncharacterized protein n=1 Tax=Acidisoma cellulosilyticum TaxID=2802395 RepID=A0A963Z188_9PROT|nr:hypothetical protein [Acidisoma cellulosilyticum]MCB8880137.1 hypothetical protein [Acidisoma cellulosilyticum]
MTSAPSLTVDDFMKVATPQIGVGSSPPVQSGPTVNDFMKAGTPAPGIEPSSEPSATPPQPPASGGPTVEDFMKVATPQPGSSPEPDSGAVSSPGILHSLAAGAASGVQDVADAAKWMWNNASAPGLAEVEGGNLNTAATPDMMLPKKTAPAQIPVVSKFVQQNQPQTLGEKMAYGAGAMLPFAASQFIPGADAASEATALSKLYSAARGAGALAGSGAASGAGGFEGQRLGQMVGGDMGGEIGGTIGSLVGGILPLAGGYSAAKAADAIGDFVPLTTGAKMKGASRVLANADPDLTAARANVSARTAPGATIQAGGRSVPLGPNGEIVDGATPTAVQMAGSTPLARVAEGLKARGYGDSLVEAEQNQEAARANAVRGLAPDNADTSSLGAFFRQAQGDQDALYQRQLAGENQTRDAALATQPGAAGEIQPYQAGQQLQGALSAGDQARKRATDTLFNALRQKNPVIDVTPLKQSASDIESGISSLRAGDVSSAERELYKRAQALGSAPNTTWGQVQQLRSEVGNAITDSTVQYGAASPATLRLSRLKSGIDDATASAVDRLPSQDPAWAALQSQVVGTIPSQASVDEARMGLERMAATGRASENSTRTATGADGSPSGSPGSGGLPQEGGERSGVGTAGARPGGYGGAEPDALNAQGAWDSSDAATYSDALAQHAARKRLYSNPQIGHILAKAPGGNLALAPESVVKEAVPTGPSGGVMARSIAATAQDDPNIMNYYQSIVGLGLRNSVVRDGQVNRSLLAAWTRNHQALLSELPETARRLTSIDSAQQFVDEAAKSAAVASDVFKTKAISSLMGGDDPSVSMQHLLNGTTADAAKFLNYIRRDPAAHAGAQKAMADNLANSLLSPKAAGSAGDEGVQISRVRGLLREPSKLAIIRSIIGPQAPQTLRRILDDYDLYNTPAMSRLGAAGSRTTPLAHAANNIGQPTTTLGRMMQELSRPVVNTVLAAATHPAAAVPTFLASTAGQAIISKSREAVAQIVAHALVDPKLFMKLTAPVPREAGAEARFVKQLRSMLAAAALQTSPSSQN